MSGEPITLTNTGLPFAVLAALGLVIPRLLLPRETRSHRVLLVVLAASAVLLLAVGIIGAGLMKVWSGADIAGALAASPAGTLVSLAKTSVLGLLAWIPFLAWSALSLGTRIERRREEDMRRAEG